MKKDSRSAGNLDRRQFLRIVAVAGGATACWKLGLFGPSSQVYSAKRSLPIMGTVMNLTVHGPDQDKCEEAISKTISTMQGLERMMSRHMHSSELALLNRTGRLDKPSSELQEVFSEATRLSKETSGSFDITVLPLLNLYENSNVLPDRKLLSLTGSRVDYRHIHQDKGTIQFTQPHMAASLDGIAKGYIVDRGTETLHSLGYHDVYVEAGGDLMVSGLRNKHEPWRIGIRPPRAYKTGKPLTIAVSDKAVATSGDYMQFFSPDLMNHHILNPRTGISPLQLASATVVAPSAMEADGLATALMVLGPDAGLDLIEPRHGCEAYMISKELKEYSTTGFFS